MILDNCTDDNSLFLNEQDTYSWYVYPDNEIIVIYYIIPLLATFGIVSNIAFITVVARVRFMRNATTCYLVQLAVTDILTLLTTTVKKTVMLSQTPIQSDVLPSGFAVGCIVFQCLLDMPYFASLFFISLVTFDRYIAICKPLLLRLHATSSRHAKLSVASWGIAALGAFSRIYLSYEVVCVVPPDTVSGRESFPLEAMFCISTFPAWVDLLQSVVQAALFVIALTANCAMYVAILKTIHKKDNFTGSVGRQKQTQHMKRSVGKMVVVTGGLFFILLTPLECIVLASIIGEMTGNYLLTLEQTNTVAMLFQLLSYINSAINPMVYNVTNRRYREAFKMVFWRKKEPSPTKPCVITTGHINSGSIITTDSSI